MGPSRHELAPTKEVGPTALSLGGDLDKSIRTSVVGTTITFKMIEIIATATALAGPYKSLGTAGPMNWAAANAILTA
jgi:hypothetical protein